MNLNMSLVDIRQHPFHYALFETVFPARLHASILTWLEATRCWNISRTEFYEQFEFSLDHVVVPPSVKILNKPSFRTELRLRMESYLDTRLSSRIRVLAHKLAPGQHIGIHNDMNRFGESHRLTVHINGGLKDVDGGYFILFNSGDVADVHRILRPISNTAIAFAISPDSHHAVSTQHSGIRYTLVFTFSKLHVKSA